MKGKLMGLEYVWWNGWLWLDMEGDGVVMWMKPGKFLWKGGKVNYLGHVIRGVAGWLG